jgi:Fe-S-cluster containining protein
MSVQCPQGVFFECIRCGSCCRDSAKRRRKIVLTSADLKRIAEATHLSSNEFCRASHTSPQPFRYIMRESYGACTFLDSNSMCRIYDSRPVICRCYPFTIQFDENSIVFLVSSKDCSGLGRGSRLPKGFFEKLAQEVTINFETSKESSQN